MVPKSHEYKQSLFFIEAEHDVGLSHCLLILCTIGETTWINFCHVRNFSELPLGEKTFELILQDLQGLFVHLH